MAPAGIAVAASGPPQFANLYYARRVGTPKPCYICSKETTVCLATIDVSDFLYTCQSHLSDPGFACLVPDPAPEQGEPSQEEVAKVKREWDERQRQKAKAAKAKGAQAGGGGKDGGPPRTPAPTPSGSPTPGPGLSPAPAAPSHKRYTLHRKFFSMRQDLHRKKHYASQARDKSAELPLAPRGFPTLPGAGRAPKA